MSFEINTSGLVQTSAILLFFAWISLPAAAQVADSQSPQIEVIRTRWTVPLPATADSSTEIPLSQIHTDGNLLILESQQGVQVLDLLTGSPAWKIEGTNVDRGKIVRSEPARSRGDVSGTLLHETWVGWINGGLLAIDLNAEGKVLWFRRIEELSGNELTSYRPAGTPVQGGNGVLAPLVSSHSASPPMLVSVASQGEIQWRQVALIPAHEVTKDWPSTLFVSEKDKSVFWLPGGRELVSLNQETGSTRWKRGLFASEEPPFAGDASSSLSLAGDQLFVASGTTLTRVNSAEGEMVWQHDFLVPAGVILGEAEGIVLLAGSGLKGVHQRTGLVRWRVGRAESRGRYRVAAVLHREAVIAAIGGELWSIDPKTGEVTERTPVPGLPEDASELLMTTDDMLIVTSPGQVTAFEIRLRK